MGRGDGCTNLKLGLYIKLKPKEKSMFGTVASIAGWESAVFSPLAGIWEVFTTTFMVMVATLDMEVPQL